MQKPPTELHDWFAQRTFSADAFRVDELAERKRASGLSVSVVLPARNEGPTIAGVVEAVRAAGDRLVDEVVVVDGGSSDGTAGVAAAAGARVHQDATILPHLGPALGKGDALWRSLTVTSGELVVFIDSDIRNPHPRFVWGLLGPLLLDDDVQLVKAFYERPVQMDSVLYPSGGGRVTELTARPLLNAFWPQLAGLVQPLSGEYAARRTLLESIPFFTGYGVEFGLLVDTLASAGTAAIVQVDLSQRIHRNQTVDALSRMAFGIVQVALQRLAAEGRICLPELPDSYVQFERQHGKVTLHARPIRVHERPPIASLER
ncbi:MAG TPA: glucosyl-3-phosphoglycerate synthase [Egibacteraceae bacterium]|nr:glucosyl-3-phosphoglycerate synthase [Actinomycetota bacterium]HWB73063.1 glucosyl-3-phosphoglycerate synthase [Egibacteraceae bacterium]